jgi:hypothetical protein
MYKNGSEGQSCKDDEQKMIVALGAFGAQCYRRIKHESDRVGNGDVVRNTAEK